MPFQIPKNKGIVSKAYEGFLELPVILVLVPMWLAGVTLIGSLVALLYLYWELLLSR